MKATELRIDNWIEFDYSDYPTIPIKSEIGQVTCETICAICYGNNDYDAKEIPITEEWLEKFGLVSYNLDKQHHKEDVIIGKYRDDEECYHYVLCRPNDDYGGSYYETKTIKFVHELQNFHFAFTGEELKIK